MDGALVGRGIVVVGGTSGLGLAAARAIVAAGAAVVVVGLDAASTEATVAELGAAARGLTADARDPATAPAAIELLRAAVGRFDGLYHVAGGSGRSFGDGPLHELTDEGLAGTLELNLTSLVYSNRAAVRELLARGTPGAVVNLSSVLAWSPAPDDFATHAYAAAKAAVIGFTRSCAAYYAPRNIRFNVLAPGLVETPMARRAASEPAIRARVETRQPLDGGRLGRPEDLDAAVVYLLSDAARFVTGQILAVDGGWSLGGSLPERP